MKDIQLWNFILSYLRQNNSVILSIVVNNTKGSPGKQGFKMAVSSTGDFTGSIGGGVMEYDFLKYCKKVFMNGETVNKIETLHHNRKVNVKRSGLICSGSQTNFTITLGKKDLKEVKKILTSVRDNRPGVMVFSKGKLCYEESPAKKQSITFNYVNEFFWEYAEPTNRREIVYVIGGGHVGLAVCKVLTLLEFYVIVYDNRKDLVMMKENHYADRILKGSFKELGKIIEQESYVIIVTTGFESDKEALEQVIHKDVKYIGLMGTKSKIKKIFIEALKDGVKKEELKKIYAPVGLDIKSRTPEEIAVSIAAEIIQIKNK